MTVQIDGSSPEDLVNHLEIEAATPARYWSSTRRSITSNVEEVVEIDFGGTERMLNLISFQVSRFPLVLRVEHIQDGEWVAFAYPRPRPTVPGESPPSPGPLKLLISESMPEVVDRAYGDGHPQHYGGSHWRDVEWRTEAVVTSRIRFVLSRFLGGTAPRNPQGHPVDYALALQQVKFGYQISDKADLPSGAENDEPFENSTDLLGSAVFYSIYEQSPVRAIDGDTHTAWRSEPQPVNYAVVPLYLDMRDPAGAAQVIDRFYVDPLTSGVNCNLYYSNDEPSGDFVGDQSAVPREFRTEVGNVRYEEGAIVFQEHEEIGVDVAPNFLKISPGSPWWFGFDILKPDIQSGGNIYSPVLDLDPYRLFFVGSNESDDVVLVFNTEDMDIVTIFLPEEHAAGTKVRVTVSFHPTTPTREAHFNVRYTAPEYSYEFDEDFLLGRNYESDPPISAFIGATSPSIIGLSPGFTLKGFVLKHEEAEGESLDLFHTHGEAYITDDYPFRGSGQGWSRNAILRMHPRFVKKGNQFGLIGGDSSRIENSVWHPINRDYTLRRGYMEFPPVRAKFWKFEFTGLSPRMYDTFQTIEREVLLFPPDLVRDHHQAGPQFNRNYLPHGTKTMVSGEARGHDYIDALSGIRMASDNGQSAVDALVINSPLLAESAASLGWIWQYQPWHSSTVSPRWTTPRAHVYERVPVRHRAKVAYFVGIKELVPGITNYEIDDDTEEYVEHFLSDAMVSSAEGLELQKHGYVASSAYGVLDSVTFGSYQPVKAVQFATIQTPMIQVLPDPDFLYEDLEASYLSYGDVDPDRVGDRSVRLKRFFTPVTLSDIENFFYGDDPDNPEPGTGLFLDEYTYAEIEGIGHEDDHSDYSEGGIATLGSYIPMGTGEIMAQASVSSVRSGEPVRLEIISGRDGTGTILAAAERRIPEGGAVTLQTSWSPGDLIDREFRTYGDVEDLYEEPPEFIPSGSDPYEPYEIGPGSTTAGTTTTTPAGSYYDVGPGTGPGLTGSYWRSSLNYRDIGPHGYSVSTLELGVDQYYRFTSSLSGWVSIDFYGTTLADTTWPSGSPIEFGVFATFLGAQEVVNGTIDENRRRYYLKVRAGVPVDFYSRYYGIFPSSVVQRMRISEVATAYADTVLWDPDEDITIIDVSARKEMLPHQVSTNETQGSGWRYYELRPSTNGVFGIDTYLTEATDGTFPVGFETTIEVETEVINDRTTYSKQGGLARAVFDVFTGQEVRFRVSTSAEETSDLKVRTSDIGDISPWLPPSEDPEDQPSPSDVGPGTYSAQAPGQIYPLRIGTTKYTYAAGIWVYYGFIPSESGQISIDTYLSEPDSPETGWTVELDVISGLADETAYVLDDKDRITGNVLAGNFVLFALRGYGDEGSGPVPASSTLVARVSDIDDTDLWTPLPYEVPEETTYEMLDEFTYGELEVVITETSVDEVSLRVRQTGSTNDEFTIHRMALYDDPISWSFSSDGGATWFRAPSVRNRPKGVMVLPVPGLELAWRAETFHEGSSITALYVRPWYGSRSHTAEPTHDLESNGPNDSGWDRFPSLDAHPVWRLGVQVTDGSYAEGVEFEPTWRNLVSNPSGEGAGDAQFDVIGGTVEGAVATGSNVFDEGDVV